MRCLSRIPNLDHQLAMVVRISGENLRPRTIDPVVGQRANRVGPAWTREAKHGAHDRQGSRDHQRQRSEPDGQAGSQSIDRPASQRGALQQPNQEEQSRQHVGRDHLPARTFHNDLRDGDQHCDERHIAPPAHRTQLRHRQQGEGQQIDEHQHEFKWSHLVFLASVSPPVSELYPLIEDWCSASAW
jgi:hypothetical protein